MNIPQVPEKFFSGDELPATQLNAILEWIKAVSQILPSLEISAGPGILCNRGSAGTSVSLARGFAPGSASSNQNNKDQNANFRRKLFYWSTEKIETDSEIGNESSEGGGFNVSVTPGLAMVRMHHESAPAPAPVGIFIEPSWNGKILATAQRSR